MNVQVIIPLGRWLSGILKNNVSKPTSRYLLYSNTYTFFTQQKNVSDHAYFLWQNDGLFGKKKLSYNL